MKSRSDQKRNFVPPKSSPLFSNRVYRRGLVWLVLFYLVTSIIFYFATWVAYGAFNPGHPPFFQLEEFISSSGLRFGISFILSIPILLIVLQKSSKWGLKKLLFNHLIMGAFHVTLVYLFLVATKKAIGWAMLWGGYNVIWTIYLLFTFYVIQFGLTHAYLASNAKKINPPTTPKTVETDSPNEENTSVEVTTTPGIDRLLLQKGNRKVWTETKAIRWVEAYGDYSKVHLATDWLLSPSGISELDKKLTAAHFQRTHRSYLVNLKFVREFGRDGRYPCLIMNDGSKVRISKSYLPEIKKILGL